MRITKIRKVAAMAAMLIGLTSLSSCDDAFEYHPYSTHLSGEHDINNRNIARIKQAFDGRDTLRVAFISDTHDWYDNMEEEIADINSRPDIDFVIHCGDLTDVAFTKEFDWARKRLQRLQKPYVCLIGNHDFLGTGADTYKWMFGELNFSFVVSRIKFMCIDTNALEYNRMANVPDLAYMKQQAEDQSDPFDRSVVVMHAPPYNVAFNNNVNEAFNYYLQQMPGLMFCAHGHDHSSEDKRIYEDNVIFHCITSAELRSYKIFTITPEGYEFEKIDY